MSLCFHAVSSLIFDGKILKTTVTTEISHKKVKIQIVPAEWWGLTWFRVNLVCIPKQISFHYGRMFEKSEHVTIWQLTAVVIQLCCCMFHPHGQQHSRQHKYPRQVRSTLHLHSNRPERAPLGIAIPVAMHWISPAPVRERSTDMICNHPAIAIRTNPMAPRT